MSHHDASGSWQRILGSLTLAVLLTQLSWSGWALAIRPDFILVVLLYWALHRPERVSFGWAFVLGLLADFQDGVVFGQHGMAYGIGLYAAQYLRLRLLQFDPLRQAAQLLPVFLAVQLGVLLIGWLAVRPPDSLAILLPVMSNTLLWILIAGSLRLLYGKGVQHQ
ncbi:MAG: rod shape-determining protein MreD [Thiobacillus sp.]